MLIQSM